ncbi:hypothetical protein [uncultured Virgibacillus sp.]|uniref:hypothetical protein n=1 Tax=uncultured Virgibacillus sp. TaxID=417355 RepID=UPI002618CF9C|nr:hypothetical protein [uncultured Virgibacillus sp.]
MRSVFIPHGWLGEPIGHLLAVEPTISYNGFSSLLEGGLLPVICGINFERQHTQKQHKGFWMCE